MAVNIRVLVSSATTPCSRVGTNISLTIISPVVRVIKLASITQKTKKLRVKTVEFGRRT